VSLQNKLIELKTLYDANQQEHMLTKNNLEHAMKHNIAWQDEKDKYIEDLKQAHKLTLTVLKENYQYDLKQMDQKLTAAIEKVTLYTREANKERENFLLKLQKITGLFKQTKHHNNTLKQQLLMSKVQNKFLKSRVSRPVLQQNSVIQTKNINSLVEA
jgi:hypothetical protein